MEQRFEHLMVPARVEQAPIRLVEYQEDGWELIAATTDNRTIDILVFFLFFKRPVVVVPQQSELKGKTPSRERLHPSGWGT